MERVLGKRIEVNACGIQVEETDSNERLPALFYIDGWEKLPGGETVYWSHMNRRVPSREIIPPSSQMDPKPIENSKT
jgi:hypothetical protein